MRATPKLGYTFSGAFIDGAFHSVNDENYFTPIPIEYGGGRTYYQKIIMDKARYIQLVYTKDSTVIFDPNGGSYAGKTANTEIQMNGELGHSTYTSTVATYASEGDTENEKKVQFVGWYIAPFPSYYDGDTASKQKGALIDGTINITYTQEHNFESKYHYTYGDKESERTATTPAADGLTFIAQWEYLQTARAMTMETTATEYVNSMNGGTVEITRLEGDESNITGRTVTTLDESGNTVQKGSGGKISKGYARMKDNVAMTAVPKPGYVFRGWYENGELLSANSTVYSYELGAGVRTIDALFRAVLQYPYLSFVSKDEKPQTTEAPFAGGTSLKVGEHPVEGYTAAGEGGIGQKVYGNTISTGFSTVQTFSDIAYDRCLWTITIPTVTADKPLYIKSAEQPTKMDVTEILPYDGAQYNAGAIYKIKAQEEQHILLRANLPTITGEGQAVFAVIIDNIYAPGATATLDLKTEKDPVATPSVELTENNSYIYNVGNEYTYNYYERSSTQSVP